MAQQVIGIGTIPNDGTGDTARTAFGKVNSNFAELYAGLLVSIAKNKAADQSVATTTLTDDADLIYGITVAGTYSITMFLQQTAGGSGGIKISVAYTGTLTTAQSSFAAFGTANGATFNSGRVAINSSMTWATTSNNTDVIRVEAVLVVTGAGNVKLQFAENTASSIPTIGKSSYMIVTKIA
jgi:hypothetical protein